MDKYKLKGFEKETIIRFDEAGKNADVYTCRPSIIKKLDKYCEEYPDDCLLERQDNEFKEYVLPKKWIKINAPKKMTEEQKEACRERGKQLYQNMLKKTK